jgi:hypothetical protein
LILRRFSLRRRGPQPLRRAIFEDSKRIFQQKQSLSDILKRSESRNRAARGPHERSDMRDQTARQLPDIASLIRATFAALIHLRAGEFDGLGPALRVGGDEGVKFARAHDPITAKRPN